MSGFYTNWDLGLHLAEAFLELKSLKVLQISIKCVIETSFLVDFSCECFEKNDHIDTLSLEGAMNVAENLTKTENKRVQRIFRDPVIQLKCLMLDHFSYHHRVSYLLGCWPNILEQIHIRKCNLDSVSGRINEKITGCKQLTVLKLDNCFIPPSTLLSITEHIRNKTGSLRLVTLELSVLSAFRKFSKGEVKKGLFKPALTLPVCESLAQVIEKSASLKHVVLNYDALDDERTRILMQAATVSRSLLTLDLTGNMISNGVEKDVVKLLKTDTPLTSLFLGDNGINSQTRSAIIRESLSKHQLRLSL